MVWARKAPIWARSRASSSLCPWVLLPWGVAGVQGWAIFGGGCLGCCRGQEGRGSCALWLLPPLPRPVYL